MPDGIGQQELEFQPWVNLLTDAELEFQPCSWWITNNGLDFQPVVGNLTQVGGFPTMCLEIQPLPLVGPDVMVKYEWKYLFSTFGPFPPDIMKKWKYPM